VSVLTDGSSPFSGITSARWPPACLHDGVTGANIFVLTSPASASSPGDGHAGAEEAMTQSSPSWTVSVGEASNQMMAARRRRSAWSWAGDRDLVPDIQVIDDPDAAARSTGPLPTPPQPPSWSRRVVPADPAGSKRVRRPHGPGMDEQNDQRRAAMTPRTRPTQASATSTPTAWRWSRRSARSSCGCGRARPHQTCPSAGRWDWPLAPSSSSTRSPRPRRSVRERLSSLKVSDRHR